jgi:hypothetical protein
MDFQYCTNKISHQMYFYERMGFAVDIQHHVKMLKPILCQFLNIA